MLFFVILLIVATVALVVIALALLSDEGVRANIKRAYRVARLHKKLASQVVEGAMVSVYDHNPFKLNFNCKIIRVRCDWVEVSVPRSYDCDTPNLKHYHLNKFLETFVFPCEVD